MGTGSGAGCLSLPRVGERLPSGPSLRGLLARHLSRYHKLPVYMVDACGGAANHVEVVWQKQEAVRFGDNVRRLRTQAGLTQEALAHRVGLSKNHMQLVEAGQATSRSDGPASNPRMTTVYSLAEALGVTPHDLIPSVDSVNE